METCAWNLQGVEDPSFPPKDPGTCKRVSYHGKLDEDIPDCGTDERARMIRWAEAIFERYLWPRATEGNPQKQSLVQSISSFHVHLFPQSVSHLYSSPYE